MDSGAPRNGGSAYGTVGSEASPPVPYSPGSGTSVAGTPPLRRSSPYPNAEVVLAQGIADGHTPWHRETERARPCRDRRDYAEPHHEVNGPPVHQGTITDAWKTA